MKETLTQTLPMFMKPSQVEKLLGISYKALKEGASQGIFKKGTHFFIPKGKQFAYWDTQSLIKWMKADTDNDELVTSIIDDILKAS